MLKIYIANDAACDTSIFDVNAEFEKIMSSVNKDDSWFNNAFEFLDSSECLKKVPSIQSAMIGAVMAVRLGIVSAKLDAARNKGSDLYIMESKNMGAVKIGRTNGGANRRARQLATGCPDVKVVAVFKGKGAIESAAHRELKQHSCGGEWFSISSDHAVSIVAKVLEIAGVAK